MFTQNLGPAQGDICKRCRGTGVAPVPIGKIASFSLDATVACSCSAGNVIFDRVNELIEETRHLEQARCLRIDEANRQIRSMFQQQKSQENKK
jgi:hypothetical protein